MAVITRYIVVRNGVELDKVFAVKKEAEAYDKMLDAAEQLAQFIKQSDLEVKLDDETIDNLSVFLAKNGPTVTNFLKGVKPYTPPPPAEEAPPEEPAKQATPKKQPAGKVKPKPGAKGRKK